MNRQLIIDISTLAYSFLFQERKTIIDSNVSIIKFYILKHIFSLIENHLPDKVYLCFDSPKPWRRKIYPFYKENRKKIREKNSIESGGFVDWKLFFSVMDDFYNESKKYFPFYSFKIDEIEADDIIFFLIEKYLPQEDKKILITKDSDFIQLYIRNKNLTILDSFNNKEINHPNPIFYLQHKICVGDKSDNIPSIKYRMGEKTAEAFIKNKELEKLINEENEYFKIYNTYKSEEIKNYIRNKLLIDFTEIPKDILDSIETNIKKYDKTLCEQNYFRYFINQKYRLFIEDVSKIRKTLTPIQEKFN